MTKILVIEDEAILRGEVVEWLNLEGYEAFGASDGVEGVNEAVHHLPDLIICDITMPRLDGHGVLLEMRSNPATSSIPFIFMTARATYEDVRRGMDMGADDYITKPFTRLELLQAIQTRLERKADTERKRQQEVEQLQQALDQEHEERILKAKMTAMFSHDFRNPLTSILSSSNLLREYSDRLDEKRREEHFNRIDVSVRHLIQMLDDMLTVAQMDAGSLYFKSEPLDIEQFFHSIVEEFQVIHGDHYSIQYESSFKETVAADERLLRQIATNLISNAIKYSPQSHRVDIRLDGNNEHFVFEVQDQGIGIPESELVQIFEAFHRASNVGRIRGTGLGLAIVKQAAELHRGTVHLESQLGKGTSVRVTIPL